MNNQVKLFTRPSWLALSGLPPPSSIACAHCSAPMAFLLQLYAPYHWFPGVEAAFHRTLFVFMCRRAECHAENRAPPFAVFRSQLARLVIVLSINFALRNHNK